MTLSVCMTTKRIVAICSALAIIFTCWYFVARKGRFSRIDTASFNEINAEVLKLNIDRGKVDFSRLSTQRRDLAKQLGVHEILVDNTRDKYVDYWIGSTGVLSVSATYYYVRYSEHECSPLVDDVIVARKNGDPRPLLFQKLSRNWYLMSTP